jgi:hypothetical protein
MWEYCTPEKQVRVWKEGVLDWLEELFTPSNLENKALP